MKKDIVSLIELQTIDLEIARLDQEVNEGYQELDARKESIEKHKATIDELKSKTEDGDKRRRELEAEIEDELVHVQDRQTKLMNVQTNREYQIILKEIEDGKKKNKQREDEIVQLMELVENLKTNAAEEENLCKAEKKLLKEESKKVEAAVAKLNTQKGKILKSRESKLKKVTVARLKKYDMLREKRNGVAVVGVTDGVCHGCYMNIPPQLYNDLLRAEELLSCPTCQRLMYHLAAPEKEEA